ncbi:MULTISPECIES: YfjI family protein [Mycolicibacterium]|uniref:DUF3987 domain-containing protein n=1 Tax=Mycolicibacterium chlorophenolicum TaxID=37916 RepID=A0A0J6WBD1_9MYCO|nr:YfjI family protein [Mycolicibacterium chlorophenolicum]KMO79884.1 hypothetical protein MCHLDSM_01768 [Mycolicibacterium chlorophenolicum]
MRINADDVDPMPDDDELNDDQLDDPIPLASTIALPPFPTDSLPEPYANMVRAISEACQVDPAMPGVSALSVLSGCIGGHAEIELRPGWREPLHIFTVTVAAPGERKSAVQQAMASPILDVEAQLAEQGLRERLEALTRKEVSVKRAEKLRNVAANPKKEVEDDESTTVDSQAAMREAIEAAAMAEAIDVPPVPRIFADDATPEAIASLLAEQGGRLAILSSEGGILDIIAGRYQHRANMDVFLKGHAGDPLRIDRKATPPEFVRRPALTLGLMIQPHVLSAAGRNAEFRGRGLLARFLYAFPVSKVGRRKIAPEPVDEAIRDDYETAVQELAAGMAEWHSDPAVLTLTEAARNAMECIEAAVEPTLADGGELATLADWGAKYVGAIGRIAGLLHLAKHGSDTGPYVPVEAQTVLEAYRIGAYFRACAINAFIEMRTDPVGVDAMYLLDRIRHLGSDEVSIRDVHVASSRARFRTKADLMPGLERLVEFGWLIVMPSPKPTGGRPASPRYRVHPRVTEATQ